MSPNALHPGVQSVALGGGFWPDLDQVNCLNSTIQDEAEEWSRLEQWQIKSPLEEIKFSHDKNQGHSAAPRLVNWARRERCVKTTWN